MSLEKLNLSLFVDGNIDAKINVNKLDVELNAVTIGVSVEFIEVWCEYFPMKYWKKYDWMI